MDKKITHNRIARIVGAMFLSTLIIPLLNYSFAFQKLIVPNDFIATAEKALSNEFLYRINIINELNTALIVMGLAVSLYVLLRPINKFLSKFALCLKITEAAIWTVMALGHQVLLLLAKEQSLSPVDPQQIKWLLGFILNVQLQITAIPGILHGLCLVIFLYLLYKSDFVPRKLALFGIISFALVFAYDSMFIIAPEYTDITVIQLTGWVPSILFELIAGAWLLKNGCRNCLYQHD